MEIYKFSMALLKVRWDLPVKKLIIRSIDGSLLDLLGVNWLIFLIKELDFVFSHQNLNLGVDLLVHQGLLYVRAEFFSKFRLKRL